MGADQMLTLTRRSIIGWTGAALALPAAPIQSSILEKRRMPFTPNFADLVRNYTTTSGTADFTLGAAVNGFTSFESALQPGDSFYYSAIGVEKPSEREVGRGTLMENGAISRDPVDGAKTNFSSGTKTISLIAAAEWFNGVQTGSGGSGPKSARGFGARGDGVADDAAALQAWLDSGGHLYLPAGEYFCSATLILRRHAIVEGAGFGMDVRQPGYRQMPGSRIYFPPGIAGLDIQPQQTETDVATVLANRPGSIVQEGAAHSRISNIALLGDGDGAAVTGLKSRTLVHLDNVHVIGFAGKGFDICATSDIPDGNEYGNANQCSLTNCHARQNGSHGYHLRGRDSNAGTLINCNAQQNGGWGILEESLLGNNHIQPHLAANLLGAIKAIGEVGGNKFDRPYVEGGVGSNCEIGGSNVVIGDVTLANTAAGPPPTHIASDLSSFNRIRVHWTNEPTVLAKDQGLIYQRYGLTLQGRGNEADLALVNRNGATVAYVPPATTNLHLNGDLALAKAGAASITLSDLDGSGPGGQIGIYSANVRQMQIYAGGGTGYISADTLVIRDCATATDTRATLSSAGLNLGEGKAVQLNGATVIDGSRNVSAAAILASGSITSSGGGVGYSAGAGGRVVQTASKSNAVTLNKLSGEVTMNGAALLANAAVSFTLSNDQISSGDVLILNHAAGGTLGAYVLDARCGGGSALICVRNMTAEALSEPIVIRFAVIKAAAA